MGKLLILFLFFITLISSVDAQYKWIERKYDKPISELSDLELSSALNSAKHLSLAGGIISVVGVGSLFTAAIMSKNVTWGNMEVVGIILLAGFILPPVGITLLFIGSNRVNKIKTFRASNQEISNLSIYPTLIRSSLNNNISPSLTISIRF